MFQQWARQHAAAAGDEQSFDMTITVSQYTLLVNTFYFSVRRFLLQQQLSGRGDTQRLQEELRPPETGDFSLKIVDVNRTSKGARAGRVQGFSALVVVGNQNVCSVDFDAACQCACIHCVTICLVLASPPSSSLATRTCVSFESQPLIQL